MHDLFDKEWNLTTYFAQVLAAIENAGNPGLLTGVCIVGDDNCDRNEWFSLNFIRVALGLDIRGWPNVGVLSASASDFAYIFMSRGVHFTPEGYCLKQLKVRNVTALCLAVSDVVLVVNDASGREFNPFQLHGAFESFFNLLHITATLETKLRPAKFISVDLCREGAAYRNTLNEAAPVLLRQVNESIGKDRCLKLVWSNYELQYTRRDLSFSKSSAQALEALRTDITTSTPRFTRATWCAFMQASWDRITEGKMPTIETAVALFRDRIERRKTEMLNRIQTASLQDLYNCSVLNDAQDALEREVDVLPSWVALDPAHSDVTLSRDLISAALDAGLKYLTDEFVGEFRELVDNVSASTEDDIASWSGMRSKMDFMKIDQGPAFTQAAAGIRLVKYRQGRRLLGLGLIPDAIDLAHLGGNEQEIDRLAHSRLDEGWAEFVRTLGQVVETKLKAFSQLLVQHICQESDDIINSFETLCTLPDVSNLADSTWALCVSETRSLWKLYGRACKSLLVTPDQLRTCCVAVTSSLLGEKVTETTVRHPWDTVLMQVMSYLVSRFDLSVKGAVRLFKLRDKVRRAKGSSPTQAVKETEALKHALLHLDLVGTRPRSLCVDALPLLQLEPDEKKLLTLSLDSVHVAWKQFASELQSDTTPDTHIDPETGSPASGSSTADRTWNFTSD